MFGSLVPLLLGATMAQASVADSWQNWESNFFSDGTPRPVRYTQDMTVWPNRLSTSNSDRWIVENHDRIRKMEPRLLLISFVNGVPEEEQGKAMREFKRLADALNVSSKHKGYANPDAPAFLEYGVFKYIDLGDPDAPRDTNNERSPIKEEVPAPAVNMDYDALFGEEYAEYYGVVDPDDRNRYLTLGELLEEGYVHEVWVTAEADGFLRFYESVEHKPVYDEEFNRPDPRDYVMAGNGGDPDMRFTGRSLRINGLNYDRGIGCGMENLAHSMEGMANSGAIPYYTKYFHEYAMINLDERYGFPHDSFYALEYGKEVVEYPTPTTAVATLRDGTKFTIDDYLAYGGNVHFLPNGTSHYDKNPEDDPDVMTTIKDWRCGSGPGGEDVAEIFDLSIIEQFNDTAPDCMGNWIVYWRQNMPGLNNQAIDDDGQPMKNWLPFLFY
jgi:hypothetical protein